MNPYDINEFKALIAPVVEWLQKNGHPHMKIIVEQDGAELVEGVLGQPFPVKD